MIGRGKGLRVEIVNIQKICVFLFVKEEEGLEKKRLRKMKYLNSSVDVNKSVKMY